MAQTTSERRIVKAVHQSSLSVRGLDRHPLTPNPTRAEQGRLRSMAKLEMDIADRAAAAGHRPSGDEDRRGEDLVGEIPVMQRRPAPLTNLRPPGSPYWLGAAQVAGPVFTGSSCLQVLLGSSQFVPQIVPQPDGLWMMVLARTAELARCSLPLVLFSSSPQKDWFSSYLGDNNIGFEQGHSGRLVA